MKQISVNYLILFLIVLLVGFFVPKEDKIYVLSSTGINLYSEKEGELIKDIKKYESKYLNGIEINNSYIYIYDNKEIKVLSLDLELIEDIKPFKINNIKYMDIYRNNLYICAENSIFILDKKLNKLNKISLEIKKNAHHIIFEEDRLYVLDDLFMPVYIFVYNIKNPHQPEKLFSKKLTGMYLHLESQFLYENNWYISSSTSSKNGLNCFFKVFDKNNFEEKKSISHGSQEYYPEEKFTGFRFNVLDLTSENISVFKELKNDKNILGKIKFKEKNIELSKLYRFDKVRKNSRFFLRDIDNYIYVANENGFLLKYDKKGNRSLEFKIKNINIKDFYVIRN